VTVLPANSRWHDALRREHLPGCHVPARRRYAVNDLRSLVVGSSNFPERVRAIHHRETQQTVHISGGDGEYNATILNPRRDINLGILAASAQDQREHQPKKRWDDRFHGERKRSAMRRQGVRLETETRPAHSLQQKLDGFT
jgi:hypothetical protein